MAARPPAGRRGGQPLTADDVPLGSFVTAFPEGADKRELGSPVVLVREDPATLRLPRRTRRTGRRRASSPSRRSARTPAARSRSTAQPLHEPTAPPPGLACPCHYSVFDTRTGGTVVAGPAGRALPQLPLEIGPGGELRAAGGFSGPIGPSWWGVRKRERARRAPALLRRARVDATGRCARRCATSSPTTGRSCWASSRSTRSSSSSRRASSSPSSSSRASDPTVYNGPYAPLRGREVSGGLRLRAAALLRGPGGPADAPDTPLGGDCLRRRDRPAPRAHLLHRRVPQAARAQLPDRRDASGLARARGLPGLLAARRPALGHGPRDRLRRGDVDPAHRRRPRAPDLGRRVPGHRRLPVAPVHRPRLPAPGRDGAR